MFEAELEELLALMEWLDVPTEDVEFVVLEGAHREAIDAFERIAMQRDCRPLHGEHVQHGGVCDVVRAALHAFDAAKASPAEDEHQV